jgi:hypothetical protein
LTGWARSGGLGRATEDRARSGGAVSRVCLDLLAKRRPEPATGGEVLWLQPYPDRLLDELPAGDADEPETAGRWRWCEQWWKHDEAVTILTALWYGWEHAAVQALGMLDWLPRLDYFLPILCGDDGPFRLCAPNNGDLPARHDMPAPAEVIPAPPGWWSWWSNGG